MTNYLPNDEESKHYATLLQWDNIYYTPPTQDFKVTKTNVRIGLVQWQMRPYKSIDDVFEQVEFFGGCRIGLQKRFCIIPRIFQCTVDGKSSIIWENRKLFVLWRNIPMRFATGLSIWLSVII